MLRVLILDDELSGRELLSSLLEELCQEVEVVGMAESVPKGLELLELHRPDLVFLDIEMQTQTGFDFLKQAPALNFEVIFVTAFNDYAIKAFKYSAVDYLLKPIDPDELVNAVKRASKKIEQAGKDKKLDSVINAFALKNPNREQISISTQEGIYLLKIDNIIYCEAGGSYTVFHTRNGEKIIATRNLKDYEDQLPDSHFFRIHHSYLVNLKEIIKYNRGEGGQVVLSNGAILDVSKRRKDSFLSVLNKL